MANTGNSIATTLEVSDTNGTFTYLISFSATAEEVVSIVVNSGNNQTITVSQAQNWLDNRSNNCVSGCPDCETCLKPLPDNRYYHDFEYVLANGDVNYPSAFLEIDGVNVCWELEIH